MKFSVQVDVNEIINEMFDGFDPEYDSIELDLKTDIQNHIRMSVVNQIMSNHNPKIKNKIAEQAKSLIEIQISNTIKNQVEEFSKNGKLKQYSSSEEISVQDWIYLHFSKTSNQYSNTLEEVVRKEAKKCIDEIKSRYDLLFASQIITKLNDQDLLKDGVFKALMAGK